MRLAELFEPQRPTPKKKPADTVPEDFIIESLTLKDEAKERREGAVLASVLKMCKKNPLYYYIRTKAEMEHMAKEFEKSGYRYLHISCHGGSTSLEAIVAIDGSKFKAVNNRDKNFTDRKLKARMQQLEECIGRYLADLDRADRDPTAVTEPR